MSICDDVAVTDRQRYALANPISANHTDGVVRCTQTFKRLDWSFRTILTVERRDGLWWHASVSMLSRHLKPIPIATLNPAEQKIVERIARQLLIGVGESVEDIRRDEVAIHIIRQLSADEASSEIA
jgi:hypothetical protein